MIVMNELVNVNNNNIINIENIRGYVDQTSGVVFLNLEDVCRGLGFTENAPSGNITIRWRRVQNYLLAIENQGIATCGDGNINKRNVYSCPQMGTLSSQKIEYHMVK